MTQKEMIQLNKEEFDRWLSEYPRKLERDVYGVSHPPLVTWNDFQRAPYWPDSIVARTLAGSGEYFVLKDINAPVKTTIKPDLEPLFDRNGVPVEIGDTVRVYWGSEYAPATGLIEHVKLHTVRKRNIGTSYESWGITGCANLLRHMDFTKVSKNPQT